MTDLALPNPLSGWDGSSVILALAWSAKTCGKLKPSIAAPPTRRNSRRVTPSHNRPGLLENENIVVTSFRET